MSESIPVLPANLANCGQLRGYSYDKVSNRVVSNPSVGPVRVRVISKVKKTEVKILFKFTSDELDQMDKFYEQVLIEGTQPFMMPLRTPRGVIDCEVFLLDRAKVQAQGPNWSQKMTFLTYEL